MSDLKLTDNDVNILSRFAGVFYEIKSAIKTRIEFEKRAQQWIEKRMESRGRNYFESKEDEEYMEWRLHTLFYLNKRHFAEVNI